MGIKKSTVETFGLYGLMVCALLLVLVVLAPTPKAQQPQTTNLLYSVNAKYTNGVAPGYWPTKGSGLTLNISAGTANCLGTPVFYSGGTLTMAAGTTNNVYLDTSSSCVPSTKTSVFTSSDMMIAQVVTSGGSISTITDLRTLFSAVTAGGSGFYQTVQANGSSQTQRGKLNLKSGTGITVSCSDNSGAGSTDCTFTVGGSGIASVFATVPAATYSSNTCSTPAITVAMPGVIAPSFPTTPGSTFTFVPTGDTAAAVGFGANGGLAIDRWATTDQLNFRICNQTANPVVLGSNVDFTVSAQ